MPIDEEPSASNLQDTQDANQSAEDSSSSSDAGSQDANAPKSLAEVIEKELNSGDEQSSSSEKPNSSVPDGQQPKGDGSDKQNGRLPGMPKEPEGKGEGKKAAEIPPEFHQHPRWKEITSERDTYKKQVETFEREVEVLKDDAEDFRAISSVMVNNNITGDELVEYLEFLSLRNQPEKFVEKYLELRAGLDAMCGLNLPDDLQKRVDDGEITEADARLLSKQGAQLKLSSTQNQQRQNREQAQTQTQETQRLRAGMAQEVNNFQKQMQATDPDYAKKHPLIATAMKAAIAEHGMPKTKEMALKYARYAYKQVTESLSGFSHKASTQNNPIAGQDSSAAHAHPEAKSVGDIVSRVLNS